MVNHKASILNPNSEIFLTSLDFTLDQTRDAPISDNGSCSVPETRKDIPCSSLLPASCHGRLPRLTTRRTPDGQTV